jgi:hypothetical protein
VRDISEDSWEEAVFAVCGGVLTDGYLVCGAGVVEVYILD